MSTHSVVAPSTVSGSSLGTIETHLIEMERSALVRWAQGDPSGFLEITAPDVSYFDPFIENRIDGLPQLTALYEGMRGQVALSDFEIIHPRVQLHGNVAVLTFRFRSEGTDGGMTWNTTEVYERRDEDTGAGVGQWQIIHTHWALHQAHTPTPDA